MMFKVYLQREASFSVTVLSIKKKMEVTFQLWYGFFFNLFCVCYLVRANQNIHITQIYRRIFRIGTIEYFLKKLVISLFIVGNFFMSIFNCVSA